MTISEIGANKEIGLNELKELRNDILRASTELDSLGEPLTLSYEDDLKERGKMYEEMEAEMEDELRKINKKLQEKKKTLVKQTDAIIKTQEEKLAKMNPASPMLKHPRRLPVMVEDEPDEVAAEHMGKDAQLRFLKAKLRVIKQEARDSSDELTELRKEHNALQLKAKDLEAMNIKIERNCVQLAKKTEKLIETRNETKTRSEVIDSELHSHKKELDSLKKQVNLLKQEKSHLETRLTRSLEEIVKLKDVSKAEKATLKDENGVLKKKADKAVVDLRRAEKQKEELFMAFKKQLKLIDILKKQKLFLQAAKNLQFTEEEFNKILDLGDNL